MATFPTLTTKSLVLRKYNPDDAESMFRLRSNPKVKEFLFTEQEETLEKSIQILNQVEKSYQNGTSLNWGIEHKETKGLIGYVGYRKLVMEHDQGEIGFMLEPDHWGKGYMQEAIQIVIDFGINELKLHRIEAVTRDNNHPTIHLLNKFGFKQEGRFVDYIKWKGEYLDTLSFALIA